MFVQQNQVNKPDNVLTFFVTLLEFFLSICVIHFIVILFGASVSDFLNTFLFSTFLSVICIMPCLILVDHSDPFELLFRIFIKQEPNTRTELSCVQITRGTVVGAWFGALVIPLDWDRWWQQFPLPCVFGAILGAFISCLGLLFKSKGKLKVDY